MNNDSKIDLEQAIMTVWSTADDLKLFSEAYYDGERVMTVDETFNHMEGIRCMLELRMEKLYDTYKRKFELDQYCTDPVKLAQREAFLNNFKTEAFATKKKGSKK
jgi:hypothetical protein